MVRNVTSSRTVVTKTTVSRTTDDGGTVTETSTDIQHMNTGQVRLSGSENLVPADGVQGKRAPRFSVSDVCYLLRLQKQKRTHHIFCN